MLIYYQNGFEKYFDFSNIGLVSIQAKDPRHIKFQTIIYSKEQSINNNIEHSFSVNI